MKGVYELDVYRLAEELSDLIWDAYDAWAPKAQQTIGCQIIRAADSIAAISPKDTDATLLPTGASSTSMPGARSRRRRRGSGRQSAAR